MRKLLGILALCWPSIAWAAPGSPNDCSGTVGTAAAAVSFPASGKTGPTAPTTYLRVQNVSTNHIWFNDLGSAATTTAPSWDLAPGAGFVWDGEDPIPTTVSVIATGSSSALSCAYK